MVEAHSERFRGPAAHTQALYTNMGEGWLVVAGVVREQGPCLLCGLGWV